VKNHVFIPMLRGMKHVGLHGTLSRWMVMVVEWLLSLLNPFPMSMMKYHNLLFKMLNNSETEREREGRNVGRISYFYVHYCPYVRTRHWFGLVQLLVNGLFNTLNHAKPKFLVWSSEIWFGLVWF
jgi:hypothetical protein